MNWQSINTRRPDSRPSFQLIRIQFWSNLKYKTPNIFIEKSLFLFHNFTGSSSRLKYLFPSPGCLFHWHKPSYLLSSISSNVFSSRNASEANKPCFLNLHHWQLFFSSFVDKPFTAKPTSWCFLLCIFISDNWQHLFSSGFSVLFINLINHKKTNNPKMNICLLPIFCLLILVVLFVAPNIPILLSWKKCMFPESRK